MAKTKFEELCEVNERATEERRSQVKACHDALKKLCRIVVKNKANGLTDYVAEAQAESVNPEPDGSLSFVLSVKVPTLRYVDYVRNGRDPVKEGREPKPIDLQIKIHAKSTGGKVYMFAEGIEQRDEGEASEFADDVFESLKKEVARKVSVAKL